MSNRRGLLRPDLEILEDRTVPATYKLVAGTLFISNQTGTLTITSTGGTSVTAQDGAGPLLTFTGIGTVNVTGTNLANTVNFDDTTTFNGNFFFNGGNGDDSMTLKGGKLLGNVTLQGGLGNELFQVNGAGDTIGGNVVFTDQGGNDKLNIGVNILGSVSVTGANTITVDGFGGTGSIGGNASFTNVGDGFAVDFKLFNGTPLTFGKNLAVTTGNSADSVTIAAQTIVGGNTTFNLGQGANIFTNNDLARFDGTFTYTGGAGVDIFALGSDVAFNGNVTLNMGDGTNLYDLSVDQPIAAGDFTINAGNGNNLIGPFGIAVAGNLNVNLGNGTNTFTLGDGADGSVGGDLNFRLGNGNNILADDALATIGGKLRIRSGNGNNTYTANGVATYNLDVVFGNGDDTFEYAGAGAVLNGLLDGGGRVTANTFTQGAAILAPTLTIQNFP